jgi:hypothetical protein
MIECVVFATLMPDTFEQFAEITRNLFLVDVTETIAIGEGDADSGIESLSVNNLIE